MRTATLALVLLWLPTSVMAQETAGGLAGTVTASDSIPLAEVDVHAASADVPGRFAATTDHRGRFQFPRLPVGSYRIQLRRVGFRPVVVADVPVRLGMRTNLRRLVMEGAATVVLEELSITAEAAGVDLTTTAMALTLEASHLDALPLERNFRDISLLLPAAVPSFIGTATSPDAVNIAGATGPENNYYVDGINVTNPIRGETSIDLPYNFVRDIEVRVGGPTAEDAQALGGVINVVTPTGGSRFSGQVFGFFASDATQTAARRPTGAVPAGFTFYDVGVALSGPLVRDRLSYYVAYNANVERRTDRYAFGNVDDTRHQNLFAGKLSWRAGPRSLVTLTVLGDPSRVRPAVYPLFASGIPQNAEVLQRVGSTRSLGASLRGQHTLTPTVLLEASLSQLTRLETADPATAAGRAPVFIDRVSGTLSGGHGLAYRFDALRRTAALAVSWRTAGHDAKAGLGYEYLQNSMDIDGDRASGGGEITRSDTAAYAWHWFRELGGRSGNRNPSLFLQDAWQVTSRLTLQAGVRWSRQSLTDTKADTVVLRIGDGWQPRAGILARLGRSRTHRVSAGFARVADQLSLWAAQSFGTGAESIMTYPRDPRTDTAGGSVYYAFPTEPARGGSVSGQTADEWYVGYGVQVRERVSVSVRAMRRSLRDAVQTGLDSAFTAVWGNPGRGSLARFPRPTREYHALEVTAERRGNRPPWWRVSYVLSRNRGNYPGLYLSDWRIAVPHTGPGYFFPQQHVNGEGLLPNDRTHVVKAFGAMALGPAMVGASLLLASGTPLSEYGAIAPPPPFRGFVRPRGTAGRTPTIWDLGVRVSYDAPRVAAGRLRPRVILDVQHVGSPRRPVDYDQIHFTCLDTGGDQSCPNPGYGSVTQYQPPMTARLGMTVDW